MNVAAVRTSPFYPSADAFSPQEQFPEYPFSPAASGTSNIYAAVRDCLHQLGLDKERYGTPSWNPLASLIKPGQKVVIKPNFVLGKNNNPAFSVDCSISHGSILRPLVDYAYIALNGRGSVVICDAPQHDACWEDIMQKTRVPSIQEFYAREVRNPEFVLQVIDLRPEMVVYKHHVVWTRRKLAGDPLGYMNVDLGSCSEMEFADSAGFYGADYDRRKIIEAHSGGHNVYNISKTILSADAVIAVPKLKVHKKCGVTLNLKLMVGINGTKNLIPHYRIPTKATVGDCFPNSSFIDRLDRKLIDLLLGGKRWSFGKYIFAFPWRKVAYRIGSRLMPATNYVLADGNWHGNDTVWRATLDLMKILLYADREGVMRPSRQRSFLSVVDGVIGGEGEGPLAPTPRAAGLVLAGTNPVAVDIVATRLIGFDPAKIKMLDQAFAAKCYTLGDDSSDGITLLSPYQEILTAYESATPLVQFAPHPGWRGHIELSGDNSTPTPRAQTTVVDLQESHQPHQ